MLFTSIVFVYFIAVFFPLYYFSKGKVRLWVCLLGSYLFYGWWDYRFVVLILALTLINYACGFKISVANNNKEKSTYLWLSVVSSLGILGFFKYYNFFSENLAAVLNALGFNADYATLYIILPVGISFYTFQTMSYTIDIYKGGAKHEPSLLRFATYVVFFPQLVAGPIVRASTFLPQLLTDRPLVTDNLIKGLQLVIWGYFLKVVVADSMALIVDGRFEDPVSHNGLSMLIGVLFYSFQIYGDFAGYSLIGIGIAKMLGFEFPVNFDRPYFSKSLSEFWRRWHITLSSWLRDYLYIPLGGNRKGKRRTSINLMLTMLLGGLWHGASWNFVIWGALHGAYLSVQRKATRYRNEVNPPVSGHLSTISTFPISVFKVIMCFTLVTFAWIFFRAETLADSLYIIGKISQLDSYQISGVTQKFHVIKGMMLIGILIVCEALSFVISIDGIQTKYPYASLFFTALIVVVTALFGTFGSNAFIYFQF